MNHIIRPSFLALTFSLCFLVVSLFPSPGHAAVEELNFGIINTESSQNMKAQWQPFLDDMEKGTGLKINAFFASDYAGIVTAMQYNKVQLAWYGNKSAMEAVDRANAEVFMQTVNADGSQGYYAYLIVNNDSPINSLGDMFAQAKDLTFGNGDPNSTSGFLVPGYYVFAKNNADPKVIFKRTLNSNHETNALSIANKRVDVATSNSEAIERLELTQPEKRAQIKVIWESPLIPSDPLVWRSDLPESTKEKLTTFLLNYGQTGPNVAHEKTVLNNLQWSHFKPSTNDQLLPIRQLELFKEKSSIENNVHLAAAEKEEKLRAINDKLTALNARMDELANTSGN